MIEWKLLQIRIPYLDKRTEQWHKIALYLWFFWETFKWMKSRFSVRSNSKKVVLETGSFKILHLESASESCTCFTHAKSLFHHLRYFTNNSTDTKVFFMITSFHDYFFHILWLFDVLPNFSFVTSEMKCDYYW